MSVKLAKVKSDQVPICSVTLSVSCQEREECLGRIGIGWDWDWMGLGLDGIGIGWKCLDGIDGGNFHGFSGRPQLTEQAPAHEKNKK